MMTSAVSPARFGARVEKVAYTGEGRKDIVVTVHPESREEADRFSFSLLDIKMDAPTQWYGGPDRDFGRTFLGSSFKAPDKVSEVLDAAALISGLKFDKGALGKTGLTEEGVKHRLLKGLARVLCSDAIEFRDKFVRMTEEGRNNLTL